MFRLNSTTIAFSYRDVALRSAVAMDGVCWFCCDDLLDMLGVEAQYRSAILAANDPFQRSVSVDFIQPEQARIWAHEGGMAWLIYGSDLDDAEQFALVGRIYKEIVTPTRRRLSLVKGGLVA